MATRRALVRVLGKLVQMASGDKLPASNIPDLPTSSITGLDSALAGKASLTGVREKLTTARTYYVRTDGSDTNTGLVNSSGGAFLTIQKAVDTAVALDLSTFDITIQVADGTYTRSNTLKPYATGGGAITILGNSASPANVVVSPTSANCFTGDNCGTWKINGLKVQTTTSGRGFLLFGKRTNAELLNINFGTCVNEHLFISLGAVVRYFGSWAISGSAPVHILSTTQGVFQSVATTCSISGTPDFGNFVSVDVLALVSLQAVTFAGSATGIRYSVQSNGVINAFGGGASYLPGNSAGSSATGGLYL